MQATEPKPLVVFSHGKETGPRGAKIRVLADVAQRVGWQVLSVDYAAITGLTDAPATARLAALLEARLPEHTKLVLVGSSMGGWVSSAACQTLQPNGLFLLAPALGQFDYPSQFPEVAAGVDVEVVHGWSDEVIDAQHSIEFARSIHARLHLMPDDHRLSASLDAIATLFAEFLRRVIEARRAQ